MIRGGFAALAIALLATANAACEANQPKIATRRRSAKARPAEPGPRPTRSAPDVTALRLKARAVFGTLPEVAQSVLNPITDAKVELGRVLYYDPRLSKSHDLSCNTCHDLANYGVDVREKDGQRFATSMGHGGVMTARNSPTTYNAAFHVAQFWDGRAPDVEAQAKGPVRNPSEMSMRAPDQVERTLRSMPGYRKLFKAAFPKDKPSITYDNAAKAIAAFQRKLVTPAPFDDFVNGDDVLTAAQLRGLEAFMDKGCIACHMGATFGGGTYQKLGLVKPYPTEDVGRFAVTEKEKDRYFFKVPSLRNIARTAPYFHDGSVETLKQAVMLMARHQTGLELSDTDADDIVAFLDGGLTGRLPMEYIAKPQLPKSGRKTPKPDPS